MDVNRSLALASKEKKKNELMGGILPLSRNLSTQSYKNFIKMTPGLRSYPQNNILAVLRLALRPATFRLLKDAVHISLNFRIGS